MSGLTENFDFGHRTLRLHRTIALPYLTSFVEDVNLSQKQALIGKRHLPEFLKWNSKECLKGSHSTLIQLHGQSSKETKLKLNEIVHSKV